MSNKFAAIVVGVAALVVVVGGALWLAGDEVADRHADNALTRMLSSLPPGYTVSYEDVDAAVSGDRATVMGVDIEIDFATYIENLPEAERRTYDAEELQAVKNANMRLRAGAFSISDFDGDHNPPQRLRYEVRNFELAFRGLPSDAQAAIEMFLGGRKITGQASGAYRADPASGLLEITDYVIDIDELGRFSLEGRFGGSYDWPKDGKFLASTANAETMTIEHFVMSFRDSGLMDKVYDVMAAQGDMTREEAKQGLAFIAALMAGSLDSEMGTQSVEALVTFLDNPGTLTFRMDPPAPVLAREFNDDATEEELMAAFERLNLSLTAE